MILANFIVLIPELIIAFGSMMLLLVGVFQRRENVLTIQHLTVLCILVTTAVLISQYNIQTTFLFNGQFVQDIFSQSFQFQLFLSLS